MKKKEIIKIEGLEVLDSRGNPTVAAWVYTKNNKAMAMVPSGASTGSHEALELRDNDKNRFFGKGVLKAVKIINTLIAKKLNGANVLDQAAIDKTLIALDSTENKTKLGANTILAVSMAAARAAAMAQGVELYEHLAGFFGYKPKAVSCIPMCNVINGGVHADSGLDVQEFMILPMGKKFKDRIRLAAEVYHALKIAIKTQGMVTAVGDEGGFAPRLKNNGSALDLLIEAIKSAGFVPGKDVGLAVDAAASEWYDNKTKLYSLKADGLNLNSLSLGNYYAEWFKKYPLISLEDGFFEDDFEAWKLFTQQYGKDILIVGDDLFVTNKRRLSEGITQKLANAILIKLNQIGTVTETFETIEMAKKNKFKVIVSHRSGETEDSFIADLAVAVSADYIKTGSLARSERIAKYNRLLEIEHLI